MSCKKKCPVCGSRNTKKDGKRNRRQRYKCLACRHRWGGRIRKDINWAMEAYRRYATQRQTLNNLGEKYQKSHKTLRKYLDGVFPCTGEVIVPPHSVILILDATFFSRRDGILVARAEGRNLLWKEIETEKIEYYTELLDELVFAGAKFSGFVIDGRRGVLQALLKKFPKTPIQLCQFHQLAIIKRYLSARPKLEAGKELRRIALTLTETNRAEFNKNLLAWHAKWTVFLKQKSFNSFSRRWTYTHRRLRSAYRSLMTNLPWLFTFQDCNHLTMPNTTNSCDGSFAHWKNKLRIHRGLNKKRRKKMMNYLLDNS